MNETLDDVMAAARRMTTRRVGFPPPDELDRALGRHAAGRAGWRMRQIGMSQAGWPLRLLSVGDGPRRAMILAGVHANEPIGYGTLLALSDLLTQAPAWAADWTWHLVPVFDPDAAWLNRLYGVRALTVRRYHQGFFRAAPGRAPLFRFPVRGARVPFQDPAPETRAVMQVIDEVQPDLVFELHNCDFGGAYFMCNALGLGDELRAIVEHAGLPLARTPDDRVIATWRQDGPGVFIAPPINPADSVAGARAAPLRDYLPSRTRWFGPEVPLFDTTIPYVRSGAAPRAFAKLAADLERAGDTLMGTMEKVERDLTQRTPFNLSSRESGYFGAAAEQVRGETDPDAFAGWCFELHKVRLRLGARVRRALEAEIATGNVTPAIHAAMNELEAQLEQWYEDCDRRLKPRPRRIEVAVFAQLAAILVAAEHIDRGR